MNKKQEKKDTAQFVKELLAQLDGPGPDVEAEILKMPIVSDYCPHCQTSLDRPPHSIESKPLSISEPNKS